jgi:hypothetical protein
MPSRAAVLKVHEPGSPGRPGFRRSIWGCLLVHHRGTGAYLACRELAFHPLQGTPHRSSAIHPDLRTSRHREEPKEQIGGEAARAWSDIIGTRQLPGPVPAPCGRDDCGLWVSHRSPGLACCLPVSEKRLHITYKRDAQVCSDRQFAGQLGWFSLLVFAAGTDATSTHLAVSYARFSKSL